MSPLVCGEAWLAPRPSREFAPAGDLLSCADKKVGKETAPAPSALFEGSPAMLATQGSRGTHFATLRSDSRAKSVIDARCARASGSCASRLLQRGTPKQPTPQQPTARPGSRSRRGIPLPPLSTAGKRKARSPRAQLASRTDSRRLFEQSVAARVRRGASGLAFLGDPEGAGRSGVVSLPTFLSTQESRSPAGANSRHGTCHQPAVSTERPACL